MASGDHAPPEPSLHAIVESVPCRMQVARRGAAQVVASTKLSKTPVKAPELENPAEPPMNTFSNKAPFIGKVMKASDRRRGSRSIGSAPMAKAGPLSPAQVERIVGPKATGEVCNIIIKTEGKIPYWEGQSYGVIPPGTKINSKGKEVPHGVRLYSIAASRYGDSFDGQTTTLCVRRATYTDPETGKEDPAKKGICSNFLCDAKAGDEVMMTGPTGKLLLMPKDPNSGEQTRTWHRRITME